MAGQVTVNPNWHLFGPSLEESRLAEIAAGGPDHPFGNGPAHVLLNEAHGQRMQDDARYADFLQGENASRLEEARQGRMTELVKGLLPALSREGQPVAPYLKYLQGENALPQADTSMFDQGDKATMMNQLAKAFQATGMGVNNAREGGIGTDASVLQHLFGPGFSNVAPTKVQEAGVKATADLKPKITYSSGGFATGKDGVSVTMPLEQGKTFIGDNPDWSRKFMTDFHNADQSARGVDPTTSPGQRMQGRPALAPSMNAAQPDSQSLTPGLDSNVPRDPAAYGTYNNMLSTAQQNGLSIGQSERQPNGDVLFKYTGQGRAGHVRLYRDNGGKYRLKMED